LNVFAARAVPSRALVSTPLQFLGQRQDFRHDLFVLHPPRELADTNGLVAQFVGVLHRHGFLSINLLPVLLFGFVFSRQIPLSLG
jgi:hypothetical protein